MSIQTINGLPDKEKPFVDTRKIFNSICGEKNNNVQYLRHDALKLISKEYNQKKKKLILSTDNRAEMMRNEFKTFWGINKGNFQEEILEVINKTDALSPITMISKAKWQCYYDLQADHGISIENADDIGTSLSEDLKALEIQKDPNSELVATLTKMMASQNENVLSEIKSVKSEVSNCAKKGDLSGILDQVETKIDEKLEELEQGILAQTMQMIEDHQPLNQLDKEETEKMISDAIDAKIQGMNLTNLVRAPTVEEILAAGMLDVLESRKYATAVGENKRQGLLRLTLRNNAGQNGEESTTLFRENANSNSGYDLDYAKIEQIIGAKFKPMGGKPRVSRKQNLVLNIAITNCDRGKMLTFVHQLIRKNYHNKIVHLDLKTPAEYDIMSVLDAWKDKTLIVNYDVKSYGFLQITVNDGDINKQGYEYNDSCSLLNPKNPASLLRIQPVTKLKLRNLATNKFFVMNNEVVARPAELQRHVDERSVIRVSKHPIVEIDQN